MEQAQTEKIKINSFSKLFDEKLTKYTSEKSGTVFNITNIRGIILHQDAKYESAVELVTKLIESKKNPYHFIIESDGTIYQVNPIDRALDHAYLDTYTEKANKYFGNDLCPISEFKERDQKSPNICTLSICLPEGKLSSNTYNALVKLCAYLINKYSKSLQATENILSMFEISKHYEDPSSFKDNAEFYRMFKFDVEKLRSNWLLHYGGLSRGYPTEEIYDVLEKE